MSKAAVIPPLFLAIFRLFRYNQNDIVFQRRNLS